MFVIRTTECQPRGNRNNAELERIAAQILALRTTKLQHQCRPMLPRRSSSNRRASQCEEHPHIITAATRKWSQNERSTLRITCAGNSLELAPTSTNATEPEQFAAQMFAQGGP